MPAITKPNQHFDATLWTGNGTTQNITNAGVFQPDLVWIKNRGQNTYHVLMDSQRGPVSGRYNILWPNDTLAEYTYTSNAAWFDAYGWLSSINSNGFSVAEGVTGNSNFNSTSNNYVAWQWKAGGAAVPNTSGTISSQVSANPTAGFSIVTYTGTGSNATVGHGLGATPSMVTVRCRSTAGESWHTYHVRLSSLSNTVYLNGSAAEGSFATCFNSMSTLNSTLFSLGTDGASNGSGRTYVAYCWAPVAGYSAFGSYTGNGSADGPFVYTGFRPRFVMIKRTDSTSTWGFIDTARDTYNVTTKLLFSNTSDAENTSYTPVDILSNGFKLRDTTYNISSGTYIYMAFAEAPFKYSSAR
jgi:hypothetical protein